jgi:hypothetical protein
MRMRKINKTNEKFARGRQLAVSAALVVALAAFGCTTNRYPGSGEPERVGPAYDPASITSTPGSSYGTTVIPPMSSSYLSTYPTRPVNTDALALLAAEQSFRGRILGPANPAGRQVGIALPSTGGQFVSPSMTANPQMTVNTSISSSPGVVVTNGPIGIAATGTTPPEAGVTPGVTPTLTGSTSSAALMNSTPAPVATGSGAQPIVGTVAATGRATETRSTVAAARTTPSKPMTVTVSQGAPVRLVTNASGQVSVTNTNVKP